MRGLLMVGLFIAFWLGTMVMCNLGSLVLGLQHPSLPGWWLQLVEKAIPLFGLAVAALATWLASRAARPAPAPPRGYPPPPPPPSYPPR